MFHFQFLWVTNRFISLVKYWLAELSYSLPVYACQWFSTVVWLRCVMQYYIQTGPVTQKTGVGLLRPRSSSACLPESQVTENALFLTLSWYPPFLMDISQFPSGLSSQNFMTILFHQAVSMLPMRPVSCGLSGRNYDYSRCQIFFNMLSNLLFIFHWTFYLIC